MDKRIFVVCDIDEKYALNLSSLLESVLKNEYKILTFTGKKALLEYSASNSVDTILISESAYDKTTIEEIQKNVNYIYVLQETDEFKPVENVVTIDRFQSRELLLKDILNNMPDDEETHRGRRFKTHWKIIGLYSPVRRSLQTNFALTLGQMLAQKGKVLYMNFENYSGFSGLFDREFESDIIDILYFFDCEPSKIGRKLPLTVHTINGMDILPPAKSYLDTYDRGGEKWLNFFETIKTETEYEYLILDLTDAMNGLLEVMGACDRIYTMVKNDNISRAKLLQYEEWMSAHSQAEIMSKTMKFSFPQMEDLPENPEMLTKSELAGYVKAIIKEDEFGTVESA